LLTRRQLTPKKTDAKLPKPFFAVILLAVAILAFAGLAYQTVPMSTTETVTQSSTETLESYSLYMVANVVSHTISMVPAFTALGLTSGTFSVLALLVIALLMLLIIWVEFESRIRVVK
jgi:magnesium-transporting ATPase (P-type)